eukprot:SAG11_NODE_247_length_11679_cov_6.170898_9_plen_142_part_00
MRAEKHAMSQLDHARQMHDATKSNLNTLTLQLQDPGLDPFERELMEEDVESATADMVRHARRIDAWEAKATTYSVEIYALRLTVHAGGKSDADHTTRACANSGAATGAPGPRVEPTMSAGTPGATSGGADGSLESPGLSMV